jgi:hypothetical protein
VRFFKSNSLMVVPTSRFRFPTSPQPA